MPDMTPLCVLALKYGTDKGGWHMQAGDTCHVYTPAYYAMWKERREQVKNVLEVGVNYGPSLRMWRDFFPNAMVYGLDSNEACLFNEERIRCFPTDQSNADSLFNTMVAIAKTRDHGQLPGFDFIVDDGSHEEAHQIVTVNTLMPFLAKDGLFVIEDIAYDCQPERYMKQVPYPGIAINTGVGIGKAHCWDACEKCHGKEGERLLVFSHE